MAGEIIRKGDPTDHGGTVLEGSLTDICHDKPIAFMGHKVSCPECKGTYPIIEGVLTTTFYGKGVAVAGMKTACGATLVATQFTDLVDTGGQRAADASAAALAALSAGALRPRVAQSSKAGKITAISWSYGPDAIPLSKFSRHYTDLNLHVRTENHAVGDMVDIAIEDDAGADVLAGVKKLTLRAQVGTDGSATLMNALAGKTIIVVPEVT